MLITAYSSLLPLYHLLLMRSPYQAHDDQLLAVWAQFVIVISFIGAGARSKNTLSTGGARGGCIRCLSPPSLSLTKPFLSVTTPSLPLAQDTSGHTTTLLISHSPPLPTRNYSAGLRAGSTYYFYLLPTTYYLLCTTYYLLLTSDYLLLTSDYLLVTTYY